MSARGDGARALSVADATSLILDGARPLPLERVALDEALGRVLGAPVVAVRDLPPWRNASMDGFAARRADIARATREQPVMLRVVETITAGTLPTRTIAAGEAARIMTGAPLPPGADTVIRIEDTDGGTDHVTVLDARDAGMNVRPRGEDVAAGSVAVPVGTHIRPGVLGVLAAVGAQAVQVHRRPRVALLSGGDELVPLERHDEAIAAGRIVDVNTHTLAALLAENGCDVVRLGLAADDPAALRARLQHAMDADLVLTSGGVSVGDRDHVREVLRSLGAEILVHRVRIRPGAPLGFGRLGDRRWIGLPGNPVSAMVTFEVFVRPLLRRLAGHSRLFRSTVPARVREEIRTAAPLTHFLRVVLTPGEGGIHDASLTGPQGSGLITSMARADALLLVPESQREVAPGTVLQAILLGDEALHDERQVS